MFFEIFLAGLLVTMTSLVGVFFTSRVTSAFVSARLSFLVSFSAGVFLLTSGALILEVFEVYETVLWQGIGLVLLGYLLASLLERVMPESHHHHDPSEHDHHHDKTGAKKLLIGHSLHNVGDGIILVAAFLVSPALGLAVTVSILIHESLQEVSQFFVLKQAGYTNRKALSLNFITASTILLGIVLSYFTIAGHVWEGIILSLAAGFFIHVVIHDLLPHPSEHETTKKFFTHLLFVVLGLIIMATVNLSLSEDHGHGASSETVLDH